MLDDNPRYNVVEISIMEQLTERNEIAHYPSVEKAMKPKEKITKELAKY